jgi:hypothetical protein
MATGHQKTKPGFVGIGAQKCASTWIYDILSDHPEVCVSAVKEVNFFSYHFDHGYQWYEGQFDCSDDRLRGEISPSYFYEPAVPARIARYHPDAKLILALRDPVDRAISNHKHEVRVGHFSGDDLSFEAGLRNNPNYIDQGLYATHLKRWLEHFPAERILTVLFEDIVADPEQVARRVYAYLGIDESHRSEALDTRSNTGHLNRSPGLDGIRRQIRLSLARIGLAGAWEKLARSGLRNIYRRYNWLPAEAQIPPVSAEARNDLRQRFASEVEELEAILGRSLKHWRALPARAAAGDASPGPDPGLAVETVSSA